jgi:uncharacterized protein
MKRIAVIGSGISGLAAAYFLSRKHQVFVFERENRIGGHTHTVQVDSPQGSVPVDTGFIVHNEPNYPVFSKLMREIGVATQPTDMSFAVTSPDASFEYSSRGLAGFFAQRSNMLRPSHYKLFREIMRFNREAPKLLDNPEQQDWTLSHFLETGHYDLGFIERYLYPMAAALWSMPPDDIGGFPARTLIAFMHHHRMLTVNGQYQWKTIRGGSNTYLAPLTASFHKNITTGANISSVTRTCAGATIEFADRPAATFDDIVFACHGNQILPLLKNPTDTERDVLQNFTTTRNEVCLHTDRRLLPKRKDAWASWNYCIGDDGKSTVTYHMNRLQSLRTLEDYCISLNANGSVAPNNTIKRLVYYHPVFSKAAVQAQQRWAEISGCQRIHFCGAYWFNGFHEDGARSALRVAEQLGVTWS